MGVPFNSILLQFHTIDCFFAVEKLEMNARLPNLTEIGKRIRHLRVFAEYNYGTAVDSCCGYKYVMRG